MQRLEIHEGEKNGLSIQVGPHMALPLTSTRSLRMAALRPATSLVPGLCDQGGTGPACSRLSSAGAPPLGCGLSDFPLLLSFCPS